MTEGAPPHARAGAFRFPDVLEKENAVQEWRDLMGATNPAESAIGTLRKMFGQSMGVNGFHGSDAKETAEQEVKFFEKL